MIDNKTGAADFSSSTLPSEGALPADASQKMRCQMSSCQISHPRNLQRPSQLSLARLKSSCLSQRLASMLKHCFCPKILDLVLEQVYVAIWMSAVPQQGGRHTPPPQILHRHGESGRRRFIVSLCQRKLHLGFRSNLTQNQVMHVPLQVLHCSTILLLHQG